MKKLLLAVVVVALAGTLASAASASIVFSGSQGNLAASAEFSLTGNTLTIALTNTSAADVFVPAELLTALFFDIAGFPPGTLTPVSAMVGPGSVVHYGPDGGGNVGGEYAYADGLVGAPGNAGLGTSSAGFGLFGGGNFNGPDLDPPPAVNGMNYGITSAGDNLATGNAAVTGGNPLIQNQVVFTLTTDTLFDLDDISNVSFQYGTGLDEPNIPHTPEPGTMLLLGLGLAGTSGFGVLRRNRKK